MKNALRFFATVLAAGALVFFASAAPTVEIAAGETLVVTDFTTMDVGGTTIITNSLIKLNEGCTIKIPATPANAASFFSYQIQLLGNATLDLSDYDDSTVPFRLYSGVYTASAQAGKTLSVILPASKKFHLGGSNNFEVYQTGRFYSCMISKGALTLPDDTDLMFKGCTVLCSFPTNVVSVSYEPEQSSSVYTSIIASGTDVYGTKEGEIVVENHRLLAGGTTINSNQTVRIKNKCYLKAYTFTRSGSSSYSIGSATFPNDIVMESGSHLWARGGTPVYSGKISGTGSIHTQGYGQGITLKGELDGTFTFYFGQRGGKAYLQNTAIRKPITLKYTTDAIGEASYGDPAYYFQLAGYDSQPTYVPVAELIPTKVINTRGCHVYTYAKQTIDVTKISCSYNLSNNGGIIFHDSPAGQGQLNIGNLANSFRLCLYTNLNVTVTNVASGVSPLFDYWCTNALNRTTLAFKNGSTAGTVVRGVAPDVLPRHVQGLTGTLRVGVGTTNPVWNFPFDFALDDPDIAGCEGSGTLDVPASGTLRVSFASSRALPKGKWPLLTGTSGGDALTEAAWPVVYAEGPRPLNFEIVRDSTGVWLQAFNGTTVLVR